MILDDPRRAAGLDADHAPRPLLAVSLVFAWLWIQRVWQERTAENWSSWTLLERRTRDRAMTWYLAAYAMFWAVLFGYLLGIASRQQKLVERAGADPPPAEKVEAGTGGS